MEVPRTHGGRAAGQEPLTEAALAAWARDFVPRLRAATGETDELARTPDHIADQMQDAGVWLMTVPRAFGGLQASLMTWMRTVTEIGRGDGGIAWGVTLNSAAGWMAANLYPRRVVDEVFAQPGVRSAGVFSGRACTAHRVEGGIHVDKGTWFFNSGVYQADWNLLGVPMFDAAGEVAGPGIALVPMKDVKLLHDWDPSGLRGSGSTNVAMENVFIPDERIVSLAACNAGTQPKAFPGEASCHLAFGPLMVVVLAFPVLGLGLHMLEAFLGAVPKRDIKLTLYTRQGEAAATHLQVGEASARLDAARTVIEAACRDLEQWAERREIMPKTERARITRDTAFANQLAWQAIDLLASSAGGSWAWKSSEMNRVWQDAKVAVMHPFVNLASNLEMYGRMRLGIEPDLMAV